ncbi:MAG TPA: PRC-barrel domain-containing protein [Sphingobium sp.]
MKAILIATAALSLAATAPASAQLLGGGGSLGGNLGGNLGGTLGGPGAIPSIPSFPDRTPDLGSRLGGVGQTTLGGHGSGGTSGSTKVDRKAGTVDADRSASGSLGGTVGQTLDTPNRSLSGGASGNGSGNANANGHAQLVGTDTVRGTVGDARSTARDTVFDARTTASSTAHETTSAARGFARNGVTTTRDAAQASAANAISATRNQVAIARNAAGGLAAAPGMDIQSVKGKTIGKVRDVVTDNQGRVKSLVVETGDRLATLPASNFSGDGNILVSAMGAGDIKKASKDQAKASEDKSAG